MIVGPSNPQKHLFRGTFRLEGGSCVIDEPTARAADRFIRMRSRREMGHLGISLSMGAGAHRWRLAPMASEVLNKKNGRIGFAPAHLGRVPGKTTRCLVIF